MDIDIRARDGDNIIHGNIVYDWLAEYKKGNKEDIEFMKYTGLKDKCGGKIYEGDIVKNKWYTGVVKYGMFKMQSGIVKGWFIERVKGGLTLADYWQLEEGIVRYSLANQIDIEVIGNIHHNSDLIN